MTKHNRALWPLTAGILLLLFGLSPVAAQDAKTAPDDGDDRARQAIARMSDFLSKAKQFSVNLEISYDVVQTSGQKIEFGETRAVTLRRPDRVRVDTTDRNGAVSGLVFDGQQISAFDTKENVYATVAKPGSLDGAIGYFVNDLGMRLPMAGVLSERFPETVKGWTEDIVYVEESTIAGTLCDQIALHGEWEDVQMWIAKGDQPLLQRMVITYTRAEGKPQFAAQLTNWNLSPSVPDSTFAFTPPAGAAKIAFVPQRNGAPHAGVVDLKGDQP